MEAARVPARMRVLVKTRGVVVGGAREPHGLGQGDEIEGRRGERLMAPVEDLCPHRLEKRLDRMDRVGKWRRRETGRGETVKTKDDGKARRETAERKGRVVLLSD